MHFFLVLFVVFYSFFESFIYDKLAFYAVSRSYRAISLVIAAHRARCSDFSPGCRIDAESICYLSAYPGVSCRWQGGVDATRLIGFYSLSGTSSMGHFALRMGNHQAVVIMGLLGSGHVRHYIG